MSEMKDKMQIKVCSGEASTKNEQSKNAEGKNAQNKNGEKSVTVRVQKIKKNHIKQKLIFFLILAIGLVIVRFFQNVSVHMIHTPRICPVPFSLQVWPIQWEQIHMEGICFRV